MTRIFALCAALIAAVAGYTVYWFYLAGAAEERITAWTREQAEAGRVVSHAELTLGGFPYRLTVHARDLAIAAPEHPLAWTWRAETATLLLQPWDLSHVIGAVEGPNRFEFGRGRERTVIEAAAAAARASLVLDGAGQVARAAADIQDLVLHPLDSLAAVRVRRIQLHARRPEDAPADRLDAVLRIEDLMLPDGSGGPLGAHLGAALIDASLRGPPPRVFAPAEVAAWRDAGGVVESNRIALDWGPVSLTARGTVALDAEMRPIGALVAEIRGLDALIELLAAEGRLSAKRAVAARVLFVLLAAGEPGARPVLKLPVTLQDGWLSLGPLPLLELGPIFAGPGG